MSDLNEESIRILSRLCRIEVSEEEIDPLCQNLKKILDYMGQLQEVGVNDLSPHSHSNEQGIDALRPDIVQPHLSRELFLANAPDQVGGMIRVPPIIKQNP